MTTEPRFLALVAKVDEQLEDWYAEHYGFADFLRALKGEIMRHEPDEGGNCKSCVDYFNIRTENFVRVDFPCKPFGDMEAEVGK